MNTLPGQLSAGQKAAATRRARKCTIVFPVKDNGKPVTRVDLVASDLAVRGYPALSITPAKGNAPARIRVSEGVEVVVPAIGDPVIQSVYSDDTVYGGAKLASLAEAIESQLFAQLVRS